MYCVDLKTVEESNLTKRFSSTLQISITDIHFGHKLNRLLSEQMYFINLSFKSMMGLNWSRVSIDTSKSEDKNSYKFEINKEILINFPSQKVKENVEMKLVSSIFSFLDKQVSLGKLGGF
ncbi:hypothetical protein [Bacillus sp. AFS040349]|uniref:hypothetical protein n=1 Tax=Bacillus sp. AFS040349 TaxID=2033502 RepID=UPI000BFD98A6|nr:hypothetical protein [Bacillus sp. AFS040349]PGT83276.1 hypothetical protein COD11_13150 [Bacillus sp. AFS040349]